MQDLLEIKQILSLKLCILLTKLENSFVKELQYRLLAHVLIFFLMRRSKRSFFVSLKFHRIEVFLNKATYDKNVNFLESCISV